MKAIVLNKAGGVENFEMSNVQTPVPGENEVLIDIKSIGVNPVDFKVRMLEPVLNMICGEGYPIIIGWDIAGVVADTGDKVSKFKTGDKVFGMVNFPGRGNAYAEQLVSPEDHLALIPDGVSFESASATTLAALTALQVLKGRVSKGDKVLIQAGSGGVGHFAIQIAKHIGAHVITTSSPKNKDFVMSLGADEHIDYRSVAFEDVLSDVDFVLEVLGEDSLLKSISVTKEGGSVIYLPAPPSEEVMAAAKEKNVNASFLLVESNGDDMKTLAEYLKSGVIKPYISEVFTFENIADAHTHLESGRTVGKVVVTL